VRLFVITGQSNSLGTTGDNSEADRSPGVDLRDAGVKFWWHNVSSQNAAYPIASAYGSSEGAWTTLRAQQGDGGVNPTFWGPEFGFARTLADYGYGELAIVKASRGGGGNALWSKDAFVSQGAAGHMYQHVVDVVAAATAQLAAEGRTYEIAGLLYLQGESDSAAEADVADQRLEALVTQLRLDLPHAADMRAIVGGIAASGGNRDVVRAKQTALAFRDDRVDYFTNLDLVDALYDGLHFDKEAKLDIGRRFAERYLQAEGRLPVIDPIDPADLAAASGTVGVDIAAYVPDPNGLPWGDHFNEPGMFRGFLEGRNGQPAVGVLVETSDDRVRFGDRSATGPSSRLIVGDVPLPNPPPRALGGTGGPQGKAVRLTLVDPQDANRSAVASSVAFELGFVEPSDQLTATFLAIDGTVLHRTGVLGNGRYGFAALDRRGGAPLARIHQVVLSGPSTAGWTVGGDAPGMYDLAFGGFQVVPEPSAAWLGAWGFASFAAYRPRRSRWTRG
jgi:hypothetical protein